MLISALCDYYDILMRNGKVMQKGWSPVDITWVISLNEDGTVDDIIDYREKTEETKKGKTKTFFTEKRCAFPQRESKSAINSEYLDHRAEYIFGLEVNEDKASSDFFTVSPVKHQKYIEKNLAFIEGLHSPVIDAYRRFLEAWSPDAEIHNSKLKALGKLYGKYYAFRLKGSIYLLQDDPLISERWEIISSDTEASPDKVIAQCAITGKVLPVSRLHNKITGIRGAQSSGAGFVSFNNPSEESFGKEQSYNSCISEEAMLKYTEAFRYLMESEKNHTVIDDTHIIHWASAEEEKYDDIFNLLTVNDTMDAGDIDDLLSKIFKSAADGTIAVEMDTFDPNVTYYVAGFKPNASRLAVKFVYRQQFGKMIENIRQHITDMQISPKYKPVPLWRIKRELISPKSSNDVVDPSLTAKMLDSVINGTPYPVSLLATLVRRIKTDNDEENSPYIKMNAIRLGMVKACINRSARLSGQKEEIKMALDLSNSNSAYVCGRLFRILEEVQQKASNNSLNRTIKDSYFSSAASRPAVIFPNLLKLNQHHLAKLEDNEAYFRSKDIADVMNLLGNEFPSVLSLAEQGKFMLGYYQQMQYTFDRIAQAKNESDK